jgi:hypothetical protein
MTGGDKIAKNITNIAKKVLLLFGPIENPRWLPTGDVI